MNSSGLEVSRMIIGFYSYIQNILARFLLLSTIKKTKNIILCDFRTGILILLRNKIVFCSAYKCWTELMRNELNKIIVTSLTSEMKDVPVCSREVFKCTNYHIVANSSWYNFYSSFIYLPWILQHLIWLSFSLVFVCCLSCISFF